jgi:hypothetical protein
MHVCVGMGIVIFRLFSRRLCMSVWQHASVFALALCRARPWTVYVCVSGLCGAQCLRCINRQNFPSVANGLSHVSVEKRRRAPTVIARVLPIVGLPASAHQR